MSPKVILHNSISLDGSLTSFEPNMELHYRLAGMFKPEAHLIGSNTITTGIELYGTGVPPETASDFQKSKRNRRLPAWVIIDTKGKLEGVLHTCRQFEYVRDVIILVSQKTPKRYLQYLEERQYDHHCVGKDSVDLPKAMALLEEDYHVKTIVTDTGRILGNLLLDQGLVDQISLLIHPVIVGKTSYNMFSDIKKTMDVTLMKSEQLEKQYIWLLYQTSASLRLR